LRLAQAKSSKIKCFLKEEKSLLQNGILNFAVRGEVNHQELRWKIRICTGENGLSKVAWHLKGWKRNRCKK